MRRALILIVVWAGAGCAPDTISIGDYNAQLARADCERAARCGEFDTVDQCVALQGTAGPITPSVEAAVTAGDAVYDDVQAAECVTERAAASCAPVDEIARVTPSATCLGVLRADRLDGDPCASSVECASRVCTAACPADSCCSGTCVDGVHEVAIGNDCTGAPCAPNGWCDSGRCAALLPEGSPCGFMQQCGFGLDCFDTCEPPLTEGDPCGMYGGTPWCGYGATLWCDPETMTCRGYLGAGAPCDLGNDHCAPGYLLCGPSSTCEAFPPIGQPCAIGAGIHCGPGAYCSFAGTTVALCLPFVDDGSPCTDPGQCASGVCGAGGVCVEPAACL